MCSRRTATFQMNCPCKVYKHTFKVKIKVLQRSHLSTVSMFGRDGVFVCSFCQQWAAGSGEKNSRDPNPPRTPFPLNILSSSLTLRPLCSPAARVQRADLLLLQHRGSVHPLPSWGLPEAGLPGDQGMHPGSPPLPEREPAAGGSRHRFMATLLLMRQGLGHNGQR